MTQGIYQIRNVATGVVYVGSSSIVEQRWRRHLKDLRAGKHHARYLQRAWTKYGSSGFEFNVIEEVVEANDLIRIEQRWIDELGAYGPGGYNSYPTASSPRGFRQTPETRRKMSEAQKKRGPRGPISEETRRKMSAASKNRPPRSADVCAKIGAANRGKVMSPEARRKMSEARKGKPLSEVQRLSLKGRVRTPEQIEKHRAAILGSKHTAETKAKMSAARKGKPKSAETRRRMSDAAKARVAQRATLSPG